MCLKLKMNIKYLKIVRLVDQGRKYFEQTVRRVVGQREEVIGHSVRVRNEVFR